MLEGMTSIQFTEWMVFFERQGLGAKYRWTSDNQTALLAATINNNAPGQKSMKRTSAFMPRELYRAELEHEEVADMLASMQGAAARDRKRVARTVEETPKRQRQPRIVDKSPGAARRREAAAKRWEERKERLAHTTVKLSKPEPAASP